MSLTDVGNVLFATQILMILLQLREYINARRRWRRRDEALCFARHKLLESAAYLHDVPLKDGETTTELESRLMSVLVHRMVKARQKGSEPN